MSAGFSYRAGIIGCGRIGADSSEQGSSRLSCHAQAYRSFGQIQLVAASDLDKERLHRSGDRWGIGRLYLDYREMLEKENLDLVSICTPTEHHGQAAREVFSTSGVRGLLLEKPVASTWEEAVALTREAAVSPTVVSVHYGRRFCPVYQRAADEIHEDRLGELVSVHAIYTKGLMHNGTHLLDLLLWFLGDPAEARPMELVKEGTDPTVSFQLIWPGGWSAWVRGVSDEVCNLFELDLIFSQGRLRFVDQGHLLTRYPIEDLSSMRGFRQFSEVPSMSPTGFADSTRYAVEDLIASIQEDRLPACTLSHGTRTLALAAQVLEGFSLSSPPASRSFQR